MKKNLLIIVIAALASCATQEKTEEILTIPLQYDLANVLPFEESGLKVDYEVIPIMNDTTNLDAFISNIPITRVYKDHFYFMQPMGLPGANFKIFDKNGKFIKASVNGNGPGEIGNMLSDLYFDRENDFLLVATVGKIMKYDLMGNYIDYTQTGMSFSDHFKFGNYLFIHTGEAQDSGYVKIVNNQTRRVVGFAVGNKNTIATEAYPSDGGGVVELPISSTFSAECRFVVSNSDLYFNVQNNNIIYKMTPGDSIPSKFAKIENVYSQDKDKSSQNKFSQIHNLAVADAGNLFSFSISKTHTDKMRVIYDKKNNALFNHPTLSALSIYSDGEYEYFTISHSLLKQLKEKCSETEKLLIEQIEKIDGDINTYIVKTKLSRK